MLEPVRTDSLPAGQEQGLVLREVRGLRGEIAQLASAIIAQQQEIAKLNRALSTVRISRTQELALKEAIRARARQIAASEQLAGAEQRISAAIRTTLRETTGARAIGDLQAGQFDRAMSMIGTWYMTGAMRRIRRECGK